MSPTQEAFAILVAGGTLLLFTGPSSCKRDDARERCAKACAPYLVDSCTADVSGCTHADTVIAVCAGPEPKTVRWVP